MSLGTFLAGAIDGATDPPCWTTWKELASAQSPAAGAACLGYGDRPKDMSWGRHRGPSNGIDSTPSILLGRASGIDVTDACTRDHNNYGDLCLG